MYKSYVHLLWVGIVTTFAGSGAAGKSNGFGTEAKFDEPRGICIDTLGNIFVSEAGTHQIRRITASGF